MYRLFYDAFLTDCGEPDIQLVRCLCLLPETLSSCESVNNPANKQQSVTENHLVFQW
jgi:hypothetical protein